MPDSPKTITQSYRPPVDQLLKLGEAKRHEPNLNFASIGITREHIPELIRMVADDDLHKSPGNSPLVYAPVHAWWALAELRAEEAIEPLLGLLPRIDEEFEDWISESVPRVLGVIGPAAIPLTAEYLGDSLNGDWSRVAAANALEKIGTCHPGTRSECVARLSQQLESFSKQSETFNAFLIAELLDLKAVEAAYVMEKAFASGRVDESVCGDWEDVQIEFGFKTQREHARKPNSLTELGAKLRAATGMRLPDDPELPNALDDFPQPYIAPPKIGRNEPCPCGSGKKYKKCCGK